MVRANVYELESKVPVRLCPGAWEAVLPQSPVAPAAYVPSSDPYFTTLKNDKLTSVADSKASIPMIPGNLPAHGSHGQTACARSLSMAWRRNNALIIFL
ncbi:hypothetical protein ccbrp13_01550 [Ktedonobacteria bacterium brp13]|nr:hypothetical protein ccbrp13_01550 [Ktedonobacteria bacterium brp13]